MSPLEGTIFLSSTSYFLLGALGLVLLALALEKFTSRSPLKLPLVETPAPLPSAPGPRPWPLIGSLHLLGGYEVPYAAFHHLAKTYGPVFSIKLGQVNCLVVSSLQHVREVLIQKGEHFDSRPDFTRYHRLFGNDKQNSLAFSDWCEMQRSRREMLRSHTFPRAFTDRFHLLDGLLGEELADLCTSIDSASIDLPIKPFVLKAAANLFLKYFTSKSFSKNDPSFTRMVENFDKVFYEVNQGYAADFLPWLLPLHSKNLKQLSQWSHEIREFITDKVLAGRQVGEEPADYLESLLAAVGQENSSLPLDTALFALEDIVGGHSAVGNFFVKVLGFVAVRPEVQARVRQETAAATQGLRPVSLTDRTLMPYTEAVILEAIRLISSPIIPHVANQDTSVGGYNVGKDTLIFLNNFSLNMTEDLWSSPEDFLPERFLSEEGKLLKPEHFLPFGGGRRSCMGYRITQYFCFTALATLLQRYEVEPLPGRDYHVPLGNLALPAQSFHFSFRPR